MPVSLSSNHIHLGKVFFNVDFLFILFIPCVTFWFLDVFFAFCMFMFAFGNSICFFFLDARSF
jgi:hypothetical protein